jgi:hypothetical protein
MPRLALTSIAIAVLLLSACITFGYLALMHIDALPVPTADGTPDGTKASQRLKRLLSQPAKLGQRLNASVETTTASLYESSRWAKAQLLRAASRPCAGLELVDRDEACEGWAKAGECEANPDFMLQRCQLSCHSCRRGAAAQHDDWDSCKDQSSYCGQWAAVGECDSNPHYMRHMCRVTCHLCQSRACHDADAPRCKAEAEAGVCHAEPERMYRECRWRSMLEAPSWRCHASLPGLLGLMLQALGCAAHTRDEPPSRSRAQWEAALRPRRPSEVSDPAASATHRLGVPTPTIKPDRLGVPTPTPKPDRLGVPTPTPKPDRLGVPTPTPKPDRLGVPLVRDEHQPAVRARQAADTRAGARHARAHVRARGERRARPLPPACAEPG